MVLVDQEFVLAAIIRERMMAMLATFAYVRVLILWSYWLFSKVAKVANIPTGVKVAIFGWHLSRAATRSISR